MQEGKAASNTCFLCPKFKYPHPSNASAFQLHDLDKKRKCKACKATAKVHSWLCMCLELLHGCSKHQHYASNAPKIAAASSKAQKCKGPIGPLSRAELCEIDDKRRRKQPHQPLLPAPNLLSHNLRQRFAYLFSEEADQ